MPNRILKALLVTAILLLLCGCSDNSDPASSGDDGTVVLSGRVTNQFGEDTPDVKLIITDSFQAVGTTVTDDQGMFSLSGIHPGLVSITFKAIDDIVGNHERYLEAGVIMEINADTTCEFYVREFNEIFHDSGDGAVQWTMYGGVGHQDSTYVFTNQPAVSDSMILSASVQLPAVDGPVFVMIGGNAVPADSGMIQVRLNVNDEYVGSPYNMVFGTAYSRQSIFPDELQGQPEAMVKLDLTFQTSHDAISYPASSVQINDIWIFSY